MTKEEFYQELLGLARPWRVERVVLEPALEGMPAPVVESDYEDRRATGVQRR